MTKCIIYSLLAAFFLIPAIVFGQEVAEPIIQSDRPGATYRPTKLDQGVLNLEIGADFKRISDKDSDWSLNGQNYAGVIRYGLLENLELNLQANIDRFASDNNTEGGLGAFVAGMKVGIAEERSSGIADIQLDVRLRLPYFGKDAFTPDDVEPLINVGFANNLSDQSKICYSIGMFWEGGEEAGMYGFMYLHSFTAKFTVFAEHYNRIRGDFNAEPHLGFGVMYLFSDETQFDASLDFGSNKFYRFFSFNMGVSMVLNSDN